LGYCSCLNGLFGPGIGSRRDHLAGITNILRGQITKSDRMLKAIR
jgi:hypothetical protein